MLFEKKDDKPEKIRLEDPNFGKGFKGFKWITLRRGSRIDLLEEHGLRLGLVPVPAKKKPKPKKAEDNSKKVYKEKIEGIKGVGQKTAKDLIQVYPTEEHLMKALKSGKDIPIRDDLAKLIKEKFKVK